MTILYTKNYIGPDFFIARQHTDARFDRLLLLCLYVGLSVMFRYCMETV